LNVTDDPDIASKRILVLGHRLETRAVESYPWYARPKDLNVTDFDILIVDLTPFQGGGVGIAALDIPSDQFRRFLIRPDARLFVIGSINPPTTGTLELGLTRLGSPVEIDMRVEIGEVLRNVDSKLEGYFKLLLPRWSRYVERTEERSSSTFASLLFGGPAVLTHNIEALAETTFGRSIAFGLRFIARRNPDQGQESGSLIWLPPPTEADSVESVMWLLRNLFQVCIEKPLPGWTDAFQLPGERETRDRIRQHEGGITAAKRAIEEEEQRLNDLLRFKRLLYEQDDALETVVWAALRELGGKVTEPAVKGRDDGQLEDPSGRRATLEIKGRTGTLRLTDVRQLEQWRGEAEEESEKKGLGKVKGILIANLQCETSPEGRRDTVPPNCLELIARYGFSLLPTTQLFRALADHRSRLLNVDAFWKQLFETVGVTTFPEP